MNLMASVITNDITMATIEKYITSAINSIKTKKQRADESSISDDILRNFETNVSKSDIVERIEILLKNNTIINKHFYGKTSYKINGKETTYHVDLQSTNESNNNTTTLLTLMLTKSRIPKFTYESNATYYALINNKTLRFRNNST